MAPINRFKALAFAAACFQAVALDLRLNPGVNARQDEDRVLPSRTTITIPYLGRTTTSTVITHCGVATVIVETPLVTAPCSTTRTSTRTTTSTSTRTTTSTSTRTTSSTSTRSTSSTPTTLTSTRTTTSTPTTTSTKTTTSTSTRITTPTTTRTTTSTPTTSTSTKTLTSTSTRTTTSTPTTLTSTRTTTSSSTRTTTSTSTRTSTSSSTRTTTSSSTRTTTSSSTRTTTSSSTRTITSTRTTTSSTTTTRPIPTPTPGGPCSIIKPGCAAGGLNIDYYSNPFAGYSRQGSLPWSYYITQRLRPLASSLTNVAYFPQDFGPPASFPKVYPDAQFPTAWYAVGWKKLTNGGINVDANNFTLVYSGFYRAAETGRHSLCTTADNENDVFFGHGNAFSCVNGAVDTSVAPLVVSTGGNYINGLKCAEVDLVAGAWYPLRSVTGNWQGPSAFNLTIKTPSQPFEQRKNDFSGRAYPHNCGLFV